MPGTIFIPTTARNSVPHIIKADVRGCLWKC